MDLSIRKHYLDHLKWIIILILIPYHTAMAWNVWGEPFYISFDGNRIISSIVVFFSPYFMPLLFVLAGISTKYALQKRTIKEYVIERVKKLLIPFLFGTIVLMPIMSYFADLFHNSYSEGFFRHYAVFYTRYTDLSGADGGFSVGQFWFLLYLFVISIVCVGVIQLIKKVGITIKNSIPFWLVILTGVPLPAFSEWLSVGGKSLVEYLYLFMIGYFVFTDEKITDTAEKYSPLLLGIGSAAAVLDVYLFIWADNQYILLNTIAKYVSEWIMIIALIGLAKRYLNFSGKVSDYMRKRSFLFYIYHFVWVVTSMYLLYVICGNHTVIIFIGTILLSYFMTFVCCEIGIRIPFLCLVTGVKIGSNRMGEGALFMKSALFYKAMSGFYDLLDVIYFRKYDTSPRKVVNEAIKDNDKILDLCTGTGTNAVNIAKKNASVKVVGVDISNNMLAVAKSKLKKEKLLNIELFRMDAANMSFEDNCFDKVLLSLVLHEMDEEIAARIIKEAIRVLKPDGEIIITEWERSKKFFRKVIFFPIEVLEPKPYKSFVIKNLNSYFGEFGLTVTEEIHCDYSKVLKLKKRI